MRIHWAVFRTSIIILALALVSGATVAQADPDDLRAITVQGAGTVSVVPDMAHIRLGVITVGARPSDALSENSARMAAIFDQLKKRKISAGDYRTSALSLQAVYAPRLPRPPQGAPRKVTGYRASNQLTVTVRDLAMLGELIDQLVGGGANQFSGVSFAISDPTTAMDAARARAVSDALRRARLYAKSAGVKLGAVLSIDEMADHGPGPRMMSMAAAERSAEAVPMAPGEHNLRARVRVRVGIQ